ncbi:hypothetical protein [Sulfitobacter aestuariivivens]|uniref:Uncharacterized protein n=1 Tax=Sulfitobacter aestuariivivens TaxID=2766981 RepID=A0A927D2A7_9RHOB|nr:hypothetical protein [Sulfitobacter aestuariivivens]MBD3662609.1 hypothetical protein [Sulfitobacter aestuariivivens]
MERHLEKVMRAICACALALTVTGCVETAPKVAISEPDPELNFVRGYRSVADECQLVGETAFTVDFLDDASDLVACPTGSAAMASLLAETGAAVVTQTNSFTFFRFPYR